MPGLLTKEICRNKIQLVIPAEVRQTYTPEQQAGILSLSEFMDIVRNKQPKPYLV